MLRLIYLALFIFTIHFALLLYSSSTFLTDYIPKQGLEALYIISAIGTIITLTVTPSIMRRFGQRRTTLGFLAALMISTLAMGFGGSPLIVAASFVVLFVMQSVLRFDFDVYIERYSKNHEAGRDRGMALTVMNVAIAASPLLAGKLIETYGFDILYFVAAMLLVPVIVIVTRVNHIRDLKYHKAPFFRTLRALHKRRDLWNAFMANVLLEFFYVWMIIYTPIYLIEAMGFSWDTIGIILSIMLLPFIIIEYPAGYLADKFYGEKSMLIAGFIITGLSTLALPFISVPSPAIWAIMLFMTRIGAALIEIMSETYFFKKVGPEHTDLISFFRDARPMAYLGGTLGAAIILPILNYNYAPLFFIMGIIILLGTRHAFALKE